jgi:1-hydroxycarotenoid 3,4-desaturase
MMKGAAPSLSAVTWCCTGEARGMDLAHHNVFFSKDYAGEFAALRRGGLPDDPTVYVCAPGGEKYFVLVNAPAGRPPGLEEVAACLKNTKERLGQCGVWLEMEEAVFTGPAEFAAKFPGAQGALYGRALKGWRDSFQRPGAATRLPGFLLAGGSVHPGPGLPMAAISGRIAADYVLTGK